MAHALVRKPNFYLPLLLVIILFDQVCGTIIFQAFNKESHFKEFFLFTSFLIIQMIASPIQAGFSDFYCRKKWLTISLSFSFISLVALFFYNQKMLSSIVAIPMIILAKACFGNNLPLSWAAIADTQEKNFRFSLALSTSAIAMGFLVLLFLNNFFTESKSTILLIVVFFLLICMCVQFFKDIRDKKRPPTALQIQSRRTVIIGKNFKEIASDLKDTHTRYGLKAFLLWQISFYSVNVLAIDLQIRQFSSLTGIMMVGYLLGVAILRILNRVTDVKMIRIGYYTCNSSLLAFFLFFPFVNETRHLLLTCYFFYNLGTAFMPASLFSLFSKERKPHEQGKIYGLVDSTDTFGFLLGSFVGIGYNSLKFDPVYMVVFSFLCFLISWFPYKKFERTTYKNLKIS
jgi:MFS family permease